MFWTIGGGFDFDVGEGRLRSLVKFVMDASVWNLNFVLDKWQIEALGTSCLISAMSRSGSDFRAAYIGF
jgi:hypothetical protein